MSELMRKEKPMKERGLIVTCYLLPATCYLLLGVLARQYPYQIAMHNTPSRLVSVDNSQSYVCIGSARRIQARSDCLRENIR